MRECVRCSKPDIKARGMCSACYQRAWKAGEVPHVQLGVGGRGRKGATLDQARTKCQPHPCARCGITTDRELCRDCQEVEAA